MPETGVRAVLMRDRTNAAFLTLLAAVAIAAPVLNLMVPPSSPVHLSTYMLTLVGGPIDR